MAEPDPRLRLAFDEGVRAISQQREDLDRLRGRVTTLASVAAIAASVLGGFSLPKHGASNWQLGAFSVGIAAFVTLIGLACWLLRPIELTFENDSKDIAEWAASNSIEVMYANLAEHMSNHFSANEQELKKLYEKYQLAIIALGVLVAAFGLTLGLGAA